MSLSRWSAEEDAEAQRLFRMGKSFVEISHLLGSKFGPARSPDSCRRRLSRFNLPVQEFENSVKDVEINRLEKELEKAKSAAGVTSEWEDDWNGPDEWSKAEKDAIKRIEKARKQGKFEAHFDRPIAVAAISDQHIAPGTPVDFQRMREDAELIATTDGFYAVLGGDGIDGHIKHRAAILAARSQPDDQYRLFNYYLGIIAKKTLAMVTGNHEWWSNQFGGVDMVQRLAADNKICYGVHEARLTVNVGSQPYEFMVRHQSRFNSSFNQSHAVKRHFEFGSGPFDVGIIGHHHEHSCESFVRHGLIRWACRPGSYQITSAYSRQYGFADSIPTCPTFILMPGRREIIGFSDVRHAVKAFRGFA